MKPEIQIGAILIAEGAQVSSLIQTTGPHYVQGWQIASQLNRGRLLQTIHRAGWKLFSFDAIFERRVFGFDDNEAVREAIWRIVATIRTKSFNCLEITQIEPRRCLGFPYVLVSAHSWHIQKSGG